MRPGGLPYTPERHQSGRCNDSVYSLLWSWKCRRSSSALYLASGSIRCRCMYTSTESGSYFIEEPILIHGKFFLKCLQLRKVASLNPVMALTSCSFKYLFISSPFMFFPKKKGLCWKILQLSALATYFNFQSLVGFSDV